MARAGLAGAIAVLAGCVDLPTPEPLETDATTSGAGADSTGPATTNPGSFSGSGQLPGSDGTTAASEDTGDCVCPPGQHCVAGLCFDCMPSCQVECGPGQSCQCPADDPCCALGSCGPTECPLTPIAGNYAACIDEQGMGSDVACEGAPCVVDEVTAPTGAVCMPSGCDDACQCPPAPATGDASVHCEDVTGDQVGDCWLTCQQGETCPDGMFCFGGFVCLFPPAGPPPPSAEPYGDCADNPASTCQPGEDACLVDAGGTAAACSHGGCLVAGDCPAAPPTGTADVACADLGSGNTCYLDCAAGQLCPNGTTCTAVGRGSACLWPDDGFLLDETFELGALRPGWTVIDVDGHVPDAQVDFVTDAFVVTDELEPGMNFGAYGTSWYAPPAQADDWLVTPQLLLGPASVLSWEAWAPDAAYPDGYDVLISTGMPTVGDFMANPPLFTIDHEADTFTPHMVDLAAAGYADQAVYLAFRNHSYDEFVLVVDDVRVTE